MKIWIFKLLVIPALRYGCETWTLNTNLKRRLYILGTRCLHRTMGYRWYDFVSNQRLFHDINLRHCGYMGMWLATGKPIMHIGLFLKGIIQHGGGQGEAQRTHACDKSIPPLRVTQYEKEACMETRKA